MSVSSMKFFTKKLGLTQRSEAKKFSVQTKALSQMGFVGTLLLHDPKKVCIRRKVRNE